MGNSHEETDVIIVNQVTSAASQGYKTIHIVCDDTDVFVLLVYFYKTLNITSELLMVPTSSETRNVANIDATKSCRIYYPYMRCLAATPSAQSD